MLADLVDGADIGVIQGGRGASLAAEALEGLGIVGYIFRQKLERDEAAKLSVLSLVDHPHSATAEFFHDAVVGDGLPKDGVGVGHCEGTILAERLEARSGYARLRAYTTGDTGKHRGTLTLFQHERLTGPCLRPSIV